MNEVPKGEQATESIWTFPALRELEREKKSPWGENNRRVGCGCVNKNQKQLNIPKPKGPEAKNGRHWGNNISINSRREEYLSNHKEGYERYRLSRRR